MTYVENLTNEEIISQQESIKETLSEEIPLKEHFKERVISLKESIKQHRAYYKELSHELYIRTNEITICKPPKAKKKASKKKSSKKQAKILIENLIKELGMEKVDQILAKL